MVKRDWRKQAVQEEGPLRNGAWYRSPLWDQDHMLARSKDLMEDGNAWCGRPLAVAFDWENMELGGLWITNRKSEYCAVCLRLENEWLNLG